MKNIKKLNLKFRLTDDFAIFHDSRKDVRTLSENLKKACDKIDELVDELNRIKNQSKLEGVKPHTTIADEGER